MFDEPPYGYRHLEGMRSVEEAKYEGKIRLERNIRLLKNHSNIRRTILFGLKIIDSLDYRINREVYRNVKR